MSETLNLALPYILAAQAQKHLTHNEALRALDALVHLSVLDLDRSEPPAEPQEGDRHIVAAPAAGDWVGHGSDVAAFQDGAWAFFAPRAGWLAHVAADGRLRRYDGADWIEAVASAPVFGVNALGDAYNRLVVKTSSALFSHDDVSGAGNGSVLGSFNRRDAGKDAAFNFQTAYQTNALIGLMGTDGFSIRVSGDGSAFTTVLEAAGADGIARSEGGRFDQLRQLSRSRCLDAGRLERDCEQRARGVRRSSECLPGTRFGRLSLRRRARLASEWLECADASVGTSGRRIDDPRRPLLDERPCRRRGDTRLHHGRAADRRRSCHPRRAAVRPRRLSRQGRDPAFSLSSGVRGMFDDLAAPASLRGADRPAHRAVVPFR